jgi:hypothetical protein
LKSPTSAIENVVGTLPTPPAANTVVPFISQIAVSPAVSRQTMSVLRSPLKSPVPTMLQLVGTLATRELFAFNMVVPFIVGDERAVRVVRHGGAVHLPDRHVAGHILPQEVAHAVAIEIADADDAPVGRHIRDERTV